MKKMILTAPEFFYDQKKSKFKLVQRQISQRGKSPFDIAFNRWCDSSDVRFFPIEVKEAEEIITLTEEVFNEKNTNRSRSVK